MNLRANDGDDKLILSCYRIVTYFSFSKYICLETILSKTKHRFQLHSSSLFSASTTFQTGKSRHPRDGRQAPPERPTPAARHGHRHGSVRAPEIQERIQRMHGRNQQIRQPSRRRRPITQRQDQLASHEMHERNRAGRPVHDARILRDSLSEFRVIRSSQVSGRPEQQPSVTDSAGIAVDP